MPRPNTPTDVLLSLVLVAVWIAFPGPTVAQPVTKENPNADQQAMVDHWTRQALSDALNAGLPVPQANYEDLLLAEPHPREASQLLDGRFTGETDQIAPQDVNIADPKSVASVQEEAAGIASDGAFFSSSRLVPMDARFHYPYRLNGKLYFTKFDGKNEICSAAVLRPRLLLTAGHCVHFGRNKSSGFYKNFKFVPAYHEGHAPYGEWYWTWVGTTQSWSESRRKFPNSADFAIIEVADQNVNGRMMRIGDIVGWAGFRTFALSPNHTKQVGYPQNHDSGEIMHQVDSAWHADGQEGVSFYGSDMRNASSGAAWYENFGVQATGQVGALFASPNRIVGVTSFGFAEQGKMIQASSQLNDEFLDLLSVACQRKIGNC